MPKRPYFMHKSVKFLGIFPRNLKWNSVDANGVDMIKDFDANFDTNIYTQKSRI